MRNFFLNCLFLAVLALSAISCAQRESKSNNIVAQEDLSEGPTLCLLPLLVPEGIIQLNFMTNPTLQGLEYLKGNAFLISKDDHELWHVRMSRPYRASLALHNLSEDTQLPDLSKIVSSYPFIDSLDLSPDYISMPYESAIILLKREIHKMMTTCNIRTINIRDPRFRFRITDLLCGKSHPDCRDIDLSGPCANLEGIGLVTNCDKNFRDGVEIIGALKHPLKTITLEGLAYSLMLPQLLTALTVHSSTLEFLHLKLRIFDVDKYQYIENFTKQLPFFPNLKHLSIRILNDNMLNWLLMLLSKLNTLEYLDLEMKIASISFKNASVLANHLAKLSSVRFSAIENADVFESLLQQLENIGNTTIRSLSFEPDHRATHHATKPMVEPLIAFLNVSSRIEHLTMSWLYDATKLPPEMFKECKSLKKLTLVCFSSFDLDLLSILKGSSIKYLDIQIHRYAPSYVKDFLKFALLLKEFPNLRSFSFRFIKYEKYTIPKVTDLIQEDWKDVEILVQQWTQEGKRLEFGFYVPEFTRTWNSIEH